MWMTIAAASDYYSDKIQSYAAMRDKIGAKLSPTQIAETQRLAARWYLKPAEQGYCWDQFSLGLKYESGQLVEKDYVQRTCGLFLRHQESIPAKMRKLPLRAPGSLPR
jgi:TPR repeat protein